MSMSSIKGYSEQAQKRIDEIQVAIDSFISDNFVKGTNGQQGHWDALEIEDIETGKLYKPTIEDCQQYIRLKKQSQINLSQESLVGFVKDKIDKYKANKHWQASIPAEALSDEYGKVLPLVLRRNNIAFVARNILQDVHTAIKQDGELFSFTSPVDIETKYLYCNCGQFPLPISEMNEHEQILANSHLEVCQHIREEIIISKSAVSKHTIGNWDCKACYKSPDGKSNLEWCPRFLRPFRTNTPQEYASITQGSKGCYAGLLHKQIAIESTSEGNFVIETIMCDTCGYTDGTRKQVTAQ